MSDAEGKIVDETEEPVQETETVDNSAIAASSESASAHKAADADVSSADSDADLASQTSSTVIDPDPEYVPEPYVAPERSHDERSPIETVTISDDLDASIEEIPVCEAKPVQTICEVKPICGTQQQNSANHVADVDDEHDEGEIVDDDISTEEQTANGSVDQKHVLENKFSPKQVASVEENNDGEDFLRRKFAILNLSYPSGVQHSSIAAILAQAESFDLRVERVGTNSQKGDVSIVFDTEQKARQAYVEIKDVKISGSVHQISAPKNLTDVIVPATVTAELKRQSAGSCVAATPTTHEQEKCEPVQLVSTEIDVPEFTFDDPDAIRKLYVSNLLPGADDDLMQAIFGDALEKATVLSDLTSNDGSKIAVVTFKSKEDADHARKEYDGFSIEDDETHASRPMKIIGFVDHLKNVFIASKVARTKALGARDQAYNDADMYQYGGASTSGDMFQNQAPKGKAGNIWAAQLTTGRHKEPVETLNYRGGPPPRFAPSQQYPSSYPERPPPHPAVSVGYQQPMIFSHPPPRQAYVPPRSIFSGPPPPGLIAEIEADIVWLLTHSGVKWADLHNAADLWLVAEQLLERRQGQENVTNREVMKALLKAIEQEKRAAKEEWFQRHINKLHGEWRREMQIMENRGWQRADELESQQHKTGKSARHREQERLAAMPQTPTVEPPPQKEEPIPGADYVPVPEAKARRTKRDKKEVIGLMGVGALLAGLAGGNEENEEQPEEEEKQQPQKIDETANMNDAKLVAGVLSNGGTNIMQPITSYPPLAIATEGKQPAPGKREKEKHTKRRRSRSGDRRRRSGRRRRRRSPSDSDESSEESESDYSEEDRKRRRKKRKDETENADGTPNLVGMMQNILGGMGMNPMMSALSSAMPQITMMMNQMQKMMSLLPPAQQQSMMQQMQQQLQSFVQMHAMGMTAGQPSNPAGGSSLTAPPTGATSPGQVNPMMQQMMQMFSQSQTPPSMAPPNPAMLPPSAMAVPPPGVHFPPGGPPPNAANSQMLQQMHQFMAQMSGGGQPSMSGGSAYQ